MRVGTGRLNIIILFLKYQFHSWEYINGNQTFILDSHLPFICSVLRHTKAWRVLLTLSYSSEGNPCPRCVQESLTQIVLANYTWISLQPPSCILW
jgi:hypothetical protein